MVALASADQVPLWDTKTDVNRFYACPEILEDSLIRALASASLPVGRESFRTGQ